MRTSEATALLILLAPNALRAQKPGYAPRDTARYFVAADASYVHFLDSTDPWKLASLSVGRAVHAGSIIGRVNYADRFSISGAQMEADAYPRIDATTYAYLNVGYSSAVIFPEWRFGGEIFKDLPHGWETSVGFRELRFENNPVTLVTGTVGKYFGNFWISARPFVRFKSSGNEASAGVTARKYFADADQFAGIRASYGSAPSDQITPDQLARARSYSADVHGSGGPWTRAVATWSLGFAHEDLASARVRNSWTATAGTKIRF